jgi:mannose-6-phosphate isomerase-like protein (cupin superfamily)
LQETCHDGHAVPRRQLGAGQAVDIPADCWHRVANGGQGLLTMIVVQAAGRH